MLISKVFAFMVILLIFKALVLTVCSCVGVLSSTWHGPIDSLVMFWLGTCGIGSHGKVGSNPFLEVEVMLTICLFY